MSGITVAAQASDRRDIFSCIREHRIDLILLEPLMGGTTGDMLIRQLTRVAPRIPILAVTDLDESKYGIQALRAGLRGFVRKECSQEELIFAVHRILSGKTYISPELSERMLSGEGSVENAPHIILSEREMEVCTWLSRGERVCDIAEKMLLSAKTISTHKSRAFGKLKIDNVADLVRLFADHAYLKIQAPQLDEVQ
jgi:DNA-binding NarL/FixJ family response regulator